MLWDWPRFALREWAALEVRQAVVLTFQNLRFVFYSCSRLHGKA